MTLFCELCILSGVMEAFKINVKEVRFLSNLTYISKKKHDKNEKKSLNHPNDSIGNVYFLC